MKRAINLIRLAGLPLSLTLITILAGSVINRVMVVELGLPVTLASLFIAIPLLVAPVRIWLGYLSDAYPLWGRRREPYLILGALLSGVGAAAAVILVLNTTELLSIGAVATLVTLIVYGVGRNLANNTFQALLADMFAPGAPRSRAANLYEVVKMIGLIIGAGLVSQALRPYSAERLTAVVLVIGGLVVVFSTIAAIGQEPRNEVTRQAAAAARSVPFWPTFKTLLWNDPTARLFFVIVTITLLGTQMQDVLLEPYAGLVFGLDVSATTQLTMFWGIGTLISILLSGIILIKWLGLLRLFRVGIVILLVLFPMLVLAGAWQNVLMLQLTVLGLGLGTGLSAASLLAYMVQFTTLKRAGLMVGVWGVGHQLGRALASLIGGVLVDGMKWVTGGDYLVAYGTAFMLEALLLLVSLVLIGRLHIENAEALQQEQREARPVASAQPAQPVLG
ncbi:MAG: BCD family MFS transporter [Caldilineaceae bacterium]|nr:BCD family MFS transporter [Caldilineaceae bacterium]